MEFDFQYGLQLKLENILLLKLLLLKHTMKMEWLFKEVLWMEDLVLLSLDKNV